MNRISKSLLLSAALAVGAFSVSPAHATIKLIDGFEASNAPAPWKYSAGPEYPGAVGSMSLVTGNPGKGLKLAYDFSKGGVYVAVYRALSQATPAVALRLRARMPADATLSVRVRDASGQWLVYRVRRPIAPLASSSWFRSVVELGHTDSHWGGSNDGTLHGAIDSLWITVGVTSDQKAGSVVVDQIEALDSLSVAIDLPNETLLTSPVSNLIGGLGVAVLTTTDVAGLDAARSAGLSWVKTHLAWSYVERSRGVYDFGPWDKLLGLLDARGMRALFILGYSNDLYCSGPPTSATAAAAYAAYAKAAAKHFAGRGVRFEVWNEPDNMFWTPTDPVAYATVAKQAMDAVHSGDPNALVTTGGLSWFNFDFLNTALQAGFASRANAIGIHPYRGTAPPEGVGEDVLRARALIARLTSNNPPLWDTEWGYSSLQFGAGNSADARQRQAALAPRRMASSRLAGLPFAFWYNSRDDATLSSDNGHNFFGLLGADGSEQPALKSLRALRAVAQARTLVGILDVAQPLLNGLRFDGPSDTVWMLWSATPTRDVTVNVAKPNRSTNMYGAAWTPSTSYTLKEVNGPVYLYYPRAAAPKLSTSSVGTSTGTSTGSSAGLPGLSCQLSARGRGSAPVTFIAGVMIAAFALRRSRLVRAADL